MCRYFTLLSYPCYPYPFSDSVQSDQKRLESAKASEHSDTAVNLMIGYVLHL